MSASIRAALGRTALRYRKCDRFTRHYVASKLRMDPVNADVLALAAIEPFGTVIDVGCGYGQLGVALLEADLAASVVGLERRTQAISQAIRASAGLPFTVQVRNLEADEPFGCADTVMLIDVLYQLAPAAQAALLAAAMRSAGRIVIRTADPAKGARFWTARLAERMFRQVWPTSGSHVHAGVPDALAATLRDGGFTVTITPCARGTPFSNVLMVARRPPIPRPVPSSP